MNLMFLFLLTLIGSEALAQCDETCTLRKVVASQNAEINDLKKDLKALKETVKSVISGSRWIGSPAGLRGDKGDQGLSGANGAKGDQGPQGPSGANGAKGDQGPPGPGQLYWKPGNNGTVTCANWCGRDNAGCVAARKSNDGGYLSCGEINNPNLGLNCL